jgi:hypothetical protein
MCLIIILVKYFLLLQYCFKINIQYINHYNYNVLIIFIRLSCVTFPQPLWIRSTQNFNFTLCFIIKYFPDGSSDLLISIGNNITYLSINIIWINSFDGSGDLSMSVGNNITVASRDLIISVGHNITYLSIKYYLDYLI